METVEVKVECKMCGKFRTTFYVDKNEHGFFCFPDAYCPKCLAIMVQVIDHLGERNNG